MNIYNNGKIYKLTSPYTDQIYIGSTTKELSERLKGHKDNYSSYLKQKHSYTTAFELIKLNNYTITLIELWNVETLQELRNREGYHVRKTPNCINDVIPGRTKKEYRAENKEHISKQKKEYREQNLEKRLEYEKKYREEHIEQDRNYRKEHTEEKSIYNKKYREDNKEKILEYEKEYRETHVEEKKEFHKKYYQDNKEKIALQRKQQILCDCGGSYTPQHKTSHLQTTKHKKNLLVKLNNEIIL